MTGTEYSHENKDHVAMPQPLAAWIEFARIGGFSFKFPETSALRHFHIF